MEKKLPLSIPLNNFVKRLFDYIFVFVVSLLFFWWIFPIIMILIKFDTKGPVFFKQKRYGKGYKPFVCLKFRTMHINAEADFKQAQTDDSRVTKIGKHLRATGLDELPQFFNVLNGSMSIVGPRPHMIHQEEELIGRIEHYIDRLQVKPGITGWAQANGSRGEMKTLDDAHRRLQLDMYYIQNWSIWLDIKIILMSVRKMF